jgi:hypothetical protein
MFPTGTAGVALLLLRLSVAATLLVIRVECCTFSLSWTTVAAVVLALGLCMGFLTPYCASLCGLIELLEVLVPGGVGRFIIVMSALQSVVVAMIGPGGYSVDSRIFGRQRLTFPPRRTPHAD